MKRTANPAEKTISRLFETAKFDAAVLEKLNAIVEPRSKYLIAMTPRSGSSFLCDMMKRTKRFGLPDEVLNAELVPGFMKRSPGRSPEEYLRNIVRSRKTRNGVSGFKASWFQFESFMNACSGRKPVAGFRVIYLTRRDLAAQAVSLYKATASSVFHTNVTHEQTAIERLNSLDYDFKAIDYWYEHILGQERGWRRFFFENRVVPLCISYEEVEEDVLQVMQRIADFVRVNPANVALPANGSVFKKVSDDRNLQWARRFESDRLKLGRH